MQPKYLSEIFVAAAAKRLSASDLELGPSGQYELATTAKIREEFPGLDGEREFDSKFNVRLGESSDPIIDLSQAKHCRAQISHSANPPEWELRYPWNWAIDSIKEGDSLFLALTRKTGKLNFIVVNEGTTNEWQLICLFGLQPQGASFVSRKILPFSVPELNFGTHLMLEESFII